MAHQYKKQKPLTMIRISGEEHRPEYNKLMSLYRVAECADGIKSLVINCFKTTGLWGVTHDTWESFCADQLHIRRQEADRRVSEGDVARRLLSGDPFLHAITVQIKSLNLGYSRPNDGFQTKNDKTKQNVASVPHFNIDDLPAIESPHAAIATDRKLLRIVKAAPSAKWEEIATEASRHGAPTRESTKAAVAKLSPPASGKKKQSDDSMPAPLRECPIEKFRAALKTTLEHFVGLYELTDGELTKAASSVHQYCRQLNRAAKSLAGDSRR